MINKKNKILLLIFFTIFVTSSFSNVYSYAETIDTNNINISGQISYYIKEYGNKEANLVKKVLNNYPITLVYQENNGKIASKKISTSENGMYNVTVESTAGIKKAWIEIKAENNACYVGIMPNTRSKIVNEFNGESSSK